MHKTFIKFYNFLNDKEKTRLKLIFLITSLSFILEFVSISSIPIYFSLVLDQGTSIDNLKNFFSFLEIDYVLNSKDIIFLGLLVVLIFLIKNLLLFFLLIYENAFYKDVKDRLSEKLYSEFINADYEKIINFNPSNISRTTASSVSDTFLYLQSVVGLFKEFLTVLAIFLIVLIVNPLTVIIIFSIFSIISLAYYKFLRPFLQNASEKNQSILSKVIKLINEAFGSIKELRILNKEKNIKKNFLDEMKIYNKNFYYFNIIQKLPKIILEIIFLTGLMSITMYFFSKNQNFITIIPELALYTLVSLRFIPAFNLISSNFTYLKIGEASVKIIFSDLEKLKNNLTFQSSKKDKFKKISHSFKDFILLNNLNYKYPGKNVNSLNQVSGKIFEGEKIVITGKTGSGKTTLMNIMLSFLKPNSGNIYFKGESIYENTINWIKKISFVSQSCYILDSSIINNITFNFKDGDIDNEKLKKAIHLSNLSNFISTLPKKEKTTVGNNGVQLSGGERQRIAIARAIYKDSDILFMDEFSSALDVITEETILNNLLEEFKKKTIITISHREHVIKRCDKNFHIERGNLKIL